MFDRPEYFCSVDPLFSNVQTAQLEKSEPAHQEKSGDPQGQFTAVQHNLARGAKSKRQRTSRHITSSYVHMTQILMDRGEFWFGKIRTDAWNAIEPQV